MRTRLGVSLREFARLAQIHPTYLSKIELEHLPAPSPAVQKRIDDLLAELAARTRDEKNDLLRSLQSEVFESELLLLDMIMNKYARKPQFRAPLLQQMRRMVERLEAEDLSTS